MTHTHKALEKQAGKIKLKRAVNSQGKKSIHSDISILRVLTFYEDFEDILHYIATCIK
jgi:hypothetical protein